MRRVLPLLFLLPALLVAQGSGEDYRRSATLRVDVRNKVLNERIRPSWSADGSTFTYRRELPGGGAEIRLVDARTGENRPAFEDGRLAEAMAEALGREMPEGSLPITRYEAMAEGIRFMVRGDSRVWTWDGSGLTSKLLEASGAFVLPEEPRNARSGSGSDRAEITFLNRSPVTLVVYWIDSGGSAKEYARLEPGKSTTISSFISHVWQMRDESGAAYTTARAPLGGGIVIGRRIQPAPSRPGQGAQQRGQWRARVRGGNVEVAPRTGDQWKSLTTGGTGDDGFRGFWWSPDGETLILQRTKNGDRRQIHYIDSAPDDQLQPKLITQRYAKPGDKVDQDSLYIWKVGQDEAQPLGMAGIEDQWDLRNHQWTPDGKRFLFRYIPRGHEGTRMMQVDLAAGRMTALIDEPTDTFVDYTYKYYFRYLPTNEIIWMSERDGWNHLYLLDGKTGAVKQQITEGEWIVREVVSVDEKSRTLIVQVSGIHPDQDPYHLHFARFSLDGGEPTILTHGDGTHEISWAPDGKTFATRWSRVDHPPVSELRRASDGELLAVLETADISALEETGWQMPERFVAPGRDGKTPIYGVIFRPRNFDPAKSYPVVEQIYAGPHGHFVPKTFASFRFPQEMAELGFILVQIDGMGTNWRSKAFHDVAWKNLGDSGFPDRIAWMRSAAQTRPWMDLDRVGIYGGSAGGQSTLRGLLMHPEFYKVGVSDCGCHDNRVDKIWWNELWMGKMGPHYEEQSNVTQAHRLEGKLLLIVGEVDSNVDPASTMQVVDALVKADKDFDLLVMPGVGHGAAGTPYGRRRQKDFLVRHLLGVEPRW